MKLLIIDDNPSVRTTLRFLLSKDFDEVISVADPKLIPAILRENDVDVVLLDMNFDPHNLDGREGIFWLTRIKQLPSPPAVLLITAFGDVPLAVEAMKLGAEDFITKPWDNDDLKAKIKRALDKRKETILNLKRIASAKLYEERELSAHAMTLEEVKMDHIKKIIDHCGGNLSAAASQLGINRQTLYNLLKKNN